MRVWPEVPLASIASDEPNALTDGPFGSKLKTEHYTTEGVRVIRLGNLGVGEFRGEDRSFVSAEHATMLERHRVFEGDLLIAALAEPVGRCCEVPREILPAIVKADCIRFRPRPDLNRRFVMHWLNSPNGRRNAERLSHGVGRLRINMREVRELPVPTPSRSVQNAVVAWVDVQFSRLDAAVASLTRAKANVKRARASVLAAAVAGRLVPTEAELARAEGREYETASVLLARIVEERKTSWVASGVRARPTAAPQVDVYARELPWGWSWASVEELCSVGTGATPKRGLSRYWHDGTVPWVTSAAVNARFVDQADEYVTPAALAETNLTLFPPGTLLVAMYGEGKTRGKVTTTRLATTTNQALAALVTAALPLRTREWLRTFIESNYEALRQVAAGGVQPNLNVGLVKALRVPLPPLAEQARIVAEVDRRLSVLDALDVTIDANLARCRRLRQSILKRAFEGRLVPADSEGSAEGATP